MNPTLRSLLASLALAALSATRADAAVIVTLPTPSEAGSIVIENDIHFTITTAGNIYEIVFDEWVTSDGSFDSIPESAISPFNLSYSLNGGATATLPWSHFVDNQAVSVSDITPNDGIFHLDTPLSVTVGNVFTLKAATYTLAAGSLPAGFNPQAGQTFTGNAFLAGFSSTRLSANTPVDAVPEPSRALLLLGGLSTLVFRRRK